MDLVQLATGLTVLTAGLMVLCLLVAGLCACTSSRRKTVKHCETSQVEFEANAKHGLQPFQPILRQTVYREPNPSDTFPRPSDTFLRTSDTFLRPTDTFPRPFDTFPRPNPIGLIVEAPQIYPILEKITLSQQPANAYVESKPRTRFDSSCKLSSFVVTEGGKEAGGEGQELQGGDKEEGGDSEERRTVCGCLKRVELTRHLTLSLTGEAIAAAEVQTLHAFGEDECTDITCGKGGVK